MEREPEYQVQNALPFQSTSSNKIMRPPQMQYRPTGAKAQYDVILPEDGNTSVTGNNTGTGGTGKTPTTPKVENVQSVTSSAQYQQQRQQLMKNLQGGLPEAAKQTYTPISVGAGETMNAGGFQMGDVADVSAPGDLEAAQMESSRVQATEGAKAAEVTSAQIGGAAEAELQTTGQVSPATAAGYEAAKAQEAQATSVASGEVDRIVDAVEGKLSAGATPEAAIQELDKVDPKTLVKAKTDNVKNAPVVSQELNSLLEGLESGEVPTWAQPAVAQAEAMLASRGLSTSSVGKQALFNAIITSAMPIAQQNAQAKLAVFQQDLSNEQQATLANAQFFQTLTSQNLSNRQQTSLANAAKVAAMDMANADRQQQAQIENARNFLQMNIANMSNEQQAMLLDSQNRQQTLLSNQSAENASRQFNAASEQQASQFNKNLEAQMKQFNTQQTNAMSQFNVAQSNAIKIQQAQLEQEANITGAQLGTQVSMQTAQIDAQREQMNAQLQQQADIANVNSMNEMSKFNAQMRQAVEQFNAQQQFNREQFNVQNRTAIEQSNVQWRRQVNQLNTAGQNAVNQANAMNAFNLSNQALTFLWQEQRDSAKWAYESGENEEERKTRMAIAALGNESMADAQAADNIKALAAAASSLFDSWGD